MALNKTDEKKTITTPSALKNQQLRDIINNTSSYYSISCNPTPSNSNSPTKGVDLRKSFKNFLFIDNH